MAVPARAQSITPNPYRTVDLNYVYAAELGFGGYALDGLTADVYTLPLGVTLPIPGSPGWAVRLLAPVQGGLYSFNATDTNGQHISLWQQSLAFVPGVELQVPVADRVMLKPFAQFGIVHAFGDGVGNPDSWVYLTGARAVAQWPVGGYTFSLGSAAIFAGDTTIGPGFAESSVSLQVGAEVRHPLGFKMFGLTPDLGLYVANYYYPVALKFERFLEPPLRVSNQAEIGFSVGSATPFNLLFMSNPRIGVGFVFGGGLDVWHINFGFPF